MNYIFHEDAGHGWLQVPQQEIDDLNLRGKISPYSYESDLFAFLEEDLDTGVFLKAKFGFPESYDDMNYEHKLKLQKFWNEECQRHVTEKSRVRSLKSFHNPNFQS